MKINEISNLYKKCNPNRFIDLAVREVTLSSLNPFLHWNKGRVVLVGDAAHAMAPFLGQGANQALQDSYRIALAVNKINSGEKMSGRDNEMSVITREMRKYESDRRVKTTLLGSKSGILGALETIEGATGMLCRDTLFRFLGQAGVVNAVFADGATPDPWIK